MMGGGEKRLPNYLCFTALEDGTFTLTIPAGLTTDNLNHVEYSVNEGKSWIKTNNIDNEAVTITTPTIETGGKVYWRGSGIRYASSTSVYSTFSSTGTFNISGNIISLTIKGMCDQSISSIDTFIFCGLFKGSKVVDASNCVFPDKTAQDCFSYSFSSCTNLVSAPQLPATSVTSNSYRYMFNGCSSLINAPALPATYVDRWGYRGTFRSCTSLKIAPEIYATSIGNECFMEMFYDCSSLTTPPSKLMPKTLRPQCYMSMFRGCSSLTYSPKLEGETIAIYCYYAMFYSCSNFTTISDLPFKVLNRYCYQDMMLKTKVNYIKMLATDISAGSCIKNWLYNVPNVSTSIFVKHIDAQWTTTGNSGVPTNWTIIYYDPAVDKYYTDQTRATECDDHGNPI